MILLQPTEKLFYRLLLLLSSLALLFTLPLDVIDIDSSQYAEISKQMFHSGDFFRLIDNGRRYLDKPIFTFWTIASSFTLFGMSNFSFRLPALFLSFLSAYSIYRITILIWQNERQGYLASIIYLITPGFYAMVVDPKIDVYLVAYITFTYHFYYLGRKQNSNYYFLMYLMMSIGFVTKGPISVVIPALSIGGDILFRRDWKLLLSMKILPGILILSSLPTAWCFLLYRDFNSYGPAFFLWIQSFGRFYKAMYDVKFDPFYFYKNFLWAFMSGVVPMILYILFRAVRYYRSLGWREIIRKIQKNEYTHVDFVIPFWVFLFLFLISFSRYPLPQYIYWVLPGAAIYFGKVAEESLFSSVTKRIRPSFMIAGIIYMVAYCLLPIFVAEVGVIYFVFFFVGLAFIFLLAQFLPIEFLVTVTGAALFFGAISLVYYPILTSFQPSREIGKQVQELEPNEPVLYTYRFSNSKRSYAFYSDRNFRNIYDLTAIDKIWGSHDKRLLLLPSEHMESLQKDLGSLYEIETILERDTYKVATPTIAFLKKETRPLVLKKISLIWLKKVQGKSQNQRSNN